MRYTIEAKGNICHETLEFSDGSKFVKRNKRTSCGCEALDKEFSEQLDTDGFCEEIIEKVYDMFDSFGALDFLELSELEG